MNTRKFGFECLDDVHHGLILVGIGVLFILYRRRFLARIDGFVIHSLQLDFEGVNGGRRRKKEVNCDGLLG